MRTITLTWVSMYPLREHSNLDTEFYIRSTQRLKCLLYHPTIPWTSRNVPAVHRQLPAQQPRLSSSSETTLPSSIWTFCHSFCIGPRNTHQPCSSPAVDSHFIGIHDTQSQPHRQTKGSASVFRNFGIDLPAQISWQKPPWTLGCTIEPECGRSFKKTPSTYVFSWRNNTRQKSQVLACANLLAHVRTDTYELDHQVLEDSMDLMVAMNPRLGPARGFPSSVVCYDFWQIFSIW